MVHSDTMSIRIGLRKIMAQINLGRAQRGEPDLSYAALAKRAKLSPTTVSQLSTGKAKGADFDTLDQLLAALEAEAGRPVDIGELLERTRDNETSA